MSSLSSVVAVVNSVLLVSTYFLAFTAVCSDGAECSLVRALVALCCTVSLCLHVLCCKYVVTSGGAGRYFLAVFLQLQFFEGLCEAKYGSPLPLPLHECDLYGSRQAGDRLM